MKKTIFNFLTVLFAFCALMALGGVEIGMFSWLRGLSQAAFFAGLAYMSAQAEKTARRKARARK